VAVIVGLTLAASAGFAQVQGKRVAGTIQSVAAGSLTVAGRSGSATVVKTTAATKIFAERTGTFGEIRQGDSVRLVAQQAADGTLTAVSVQSAPANTVASKAGRRSMRSGNVMVSGVAGLLAGTGTAQTLTVNYPNGAATASVPQNAKITRLHTVPVSDLKAGMRVFVSGTDNPDGSITATTIMVGAGRPR